jgi:RimJ/RimL family protein N-acetyltransferase
LVEIAFDPVRRDDALAFAACLAGEIWPFHSGGPVDAEVVARRVANGEYNTASVRTHWIVVDGQRCGFVKAFDLDDGTPLFDLRIAAAHRGRGIGTATVAWLIGYLFDLAPGINRIEGTTRADNTAMRAVFRANKFAKEAHYRQAWPDPDGVLHDATGYAILRQDWLAGTLTPVNWDDERPSPAHGAT